MPPKMGKTIEVRRLRRRTSRSLCFSRSIALAQLLLLLQEVSREISDKCELELDAEVVLQASVKVISKAKVCNFLVSMDLLTN
ncbi:hypothetical protein C1H46_002233 [Malus baccata]|uniref:Uncharacterized protein n=1 Tax=Malus baccata TaxID=106549 RepID=A0A540NNH4_MALBA|nr:hypothetical protein C1H46_002233 [Malus baccata]